MSLDHDYGQTPRRGQQVEARELFPPDEEQDTTENAYSSVETEVEIETTSSGRVYKGKQKLPLTYILNDLARRDHFRKKGASLVTMVRDLEIRTKARVLLKAQYHVQNPNTNQIEYREFDYGTDFPLEKERKARNRTPSPNRTSSIGSSASGSGSSAASELGNEAAGGTGISAAIVPGDDYVVSPVKRSEASERLKRDVCLMCGGKEVIVPIKGKRYDIATANVRCKGYEKSRSKTGREIKYSCKAWVHLDCFGFCGRTAPDLPRFHPWYCVGHKDLGRVLTGANADLLEP